MTVAASPSRIAPPARGINNQASDFEYVRFN